MIEQLDLGQLLKEEDRHLGRIGRIQQAAANLEVGPEDLSQRTLTEARITIRKLRAINYIPKIERVVDPITAEIDRRALAYAKHYQSQLDGKRADLRTVETASVCPFPMRDIMRFRQEVLDFTQLPTQDPLLARGMRQIRQEQVIRGEIVEAVDPSEEATLTYADIEDRKIHFGPIQKSLMEQLLPYASTADRETVQETIPASDWTSPVWPDDSREKRLGKLKTHVHKMRRMLKGTDLSIINVEPLNASREGRFYLKVESPESEVEIPQFSPEPKRYRPLEKPIIDPPPKPLRNYSREGSVALHNVFGSFTEVGDDQKRILRQLQDSPDMVRIFNAVVNFNAKSRSEQEKTDFGTVLAGAIAEEAVYLQLREQYQRKGLTLVHGHDKFTLLRNANYSEKGEDVIDVRGYGLGFEIGGVRSADALAIHMTGKGEQEIVEEIEVKAVTTKDESVASSIREQRRYFTAEGLFSQLRLTDPECPIDPWFLGEVINKLTGLPVGPLTVSLDMRVVYFVSIGFPHQIENADMLYMDLSSGVLGRLAKLLITELK